MDQTKGWFACVSEIYSKIIRFPEMYMRYHKEKPQSIDNDDEWLISILCSDISNEFVEFYVFIDYVQVFK